MLVSILLLSIGCSAAVAAPSPDPSNGAAVNFIAPFMGFEIGEPIYFLPEEQQVAAELQGLLLISPARTIKARRGADAAFPPAPLEINFEPNAWADPATFAIYRFDGHSWGRADVIEQELSEHGIFTAKAKIGRTGTFGVFGTAEDYRLAKANMLSLTKRARPVKYVSRRSAGSKDWYETSEQEIWESIVFDISTPLPLVHWENEGVKPRRGGRLPKGAVRLERRDDRIFVIQRTGEGTKDAMEIAVPTRVLSGSWESYLNGGRLEVEVMDGSVARIAAPPEERLDSGSTMSAWNFLTRHGIRVITADSAPETIISRGRLIFEGDACTQIGGERSKSFRLFFRAASEKSKWGWFSTPISPVVRAVAIGVLLLIVGVPLLLIWWIARYVRARRAKA